MDPKDLNELRSIEELEEYQKDVRSRVTALDTEFAGLPFSDEARDEYATLKDTDVEIDKRVAELRARQEYITKMSQSGNVVRAEDPVSRQRVAVKDESPWDIGRGIDRDPFGNVTDRGMATLRDKAMRAIDLADLAVKDQAAGKERMESLVKRDTTGAVALRILATGSPTYERAFWKKISGKSLSPEEERVLSISGGGGDEGNFAVPIAVDPTLIITSDGSSNPLRKISRVVNITGNEWHGVATDGITASYDAEMTETNDDSPTLVQPVINVEKAQAFVPFSIEVGEDWAGMRTELGRAFADAKDQLEAEKFLVGAGHGSDEPEGLLVGATNLVLTGGNTTFTDANLYALTEALPERYQDNAVILANRAIYNMVRQFDTDGGAALWVQLGDRTPPTLLGYPTYAASFMDGVLADGNLIAVIGDFSRFVIVDRVGLNVELIPHLFGTARNYPNGMRGLYAYWRNSSGVVDANAFRVLSSDTP